MKNIFIISWFDKSTVKHLRLPFSFFLKPVFLFRFKSDDSLINSKKTSSDFVMSGLIKLKARQVDSKLFDNQMKNDLVR